MMTQNIEIEVPEGFEAKYNPETQKIEMIKKNNKPRTWEEFCENYLVKIGESWVSNLSEIKTVSNQVSETRDSFTDKNLCTSEAEAEAFLAMMQLRRLRKVWIDDWTPVWRNFVPKYCITNISYNICIESSICEYHNLSFPTREMANEFLECFKDLIEKAKILL